MDCEQCQKLISAGIDGSLTEFERDLLAVHLSECAECRLVSDEEHSLDINLRSALGPSHTRVEALTQIVRNRLATRPGRKHSVLAVDDEPIILSTLSALLSREYEVHTAECAESAMAFLDHQSVDVVLTDQKMPRRTGVELLEWVRGRYPGTVRLLMTGYSDLQNIVDSINRGHVYYYLLKPWRTEELLQVMRNATEKFQLERKRERYLEELRTLNRELENRVAERTRELEEANLLLYQRTRELERLALTDPLTGLLNRRAVEELARFELKRHERYPSPLALGYLDVDHFKRINTEHLLTGGDAVLRGLARMLSSTLREVDSVGRVGGEEFLIIARETDEKGTWNLAERIRTVVESSTSEYNSRKIHLTVSLGFAVAEVGVPTDFAQMSELAAIALAQAKQTGRNRSVIYKVGTTTTVGQLSTVL